MSKTAERRENGGEKGGCVRHTFPSPGRKGSGRKGNQEREEKERLIQQQKKGKKNSKQERRQGRKKLNVY